MIVVETYASKKKLLQTSCYSYTQDLGAADIRQKYSHFVKLMKIEEESKKSSEADVCDSQGLGDQEEAPVPVRPSLIEVQ